MDKIAIDQAKNQAKEQIVIRDVELSGPLLALLRALAERMLRELPEQRHFHPSRKRFLTSFLYRELRDRGEMVGVKITHKCKPYSLRQIARQHRQLEALGLICRRRVGYGIWATEFNPRFVRDVVTKALSAVKGKRFTFWAYVAGRKRRTRRKTAKKHQKGSARLQPASKPSSPTGGCAYRLPADFDADVFRELVLLLRDLQRLDGPEREAQEARKAALVSRLAPQATGQKVVKDVLLDGGVVWVCRVGGAHRVRPDP